jgi:hypothetical protein
LETYYSAQGYPRCEPLGNASYIIIRRLPERNGCEPFGCGWRCSSYSFAQPPANGMEPFGFGLRHWSRVCTSQRPNHRHRAIVVQERLDRQDAAA